MKRQNISAERENKYANSQDNRAMLESVNAYKQAVERAGYVDNSNEDRAMLASVNAYKQAVEKALGGKKRH
jgi:hypothetical protein